MPKPSERTGSRRRVALRLPGGTPATRYEERREKPAHCSNCGATLHGVPTGRARIPKSSRKPSRPYSGFLCASCLREAIKSMARKTM